MKGTHIESFLARRSLIAIPEDDVRIYVEGLVARIDKALGFDCAEGVTVEWLLNRLAERDAAA